MNIAGVLSRGRELLRSDHEAEILLAFLLGVPREHVFAHPEANVPDAVVDKFNNVLRKRADGVPVAYLVGHREFYGLDFFVDERVMIPRPETELLVEEVIGMAKGTVGRGQGTGVRGQGTGVGGLSLCDIGTGSGCIAISLAKNIACAHVTAVDISADALEVARKNVELHGLSERVSLKKSDLLSSVLNCGFDGLVANLPYIGRSENHLIGKEVIENEPHQALFGGDTGLELFERLFEQIRSMSVGPRWLVAEIGFLQRKSIDDLIAKNFTHAELEWRADLAGLDRAFIVHFNHKVKRIEPND